VGRKIMGREHYEEMHEREWDPRIEDRPLERGEVEDEEDGEETNDCPICQHNEFCKGGCEAGVDCGYRFLAKEGKQ